MIVLIASYFNTTTDYILTGKEHKNDNKVLFSVATCFSIIGIVILFIDMFLTWNIEQNFMDNYMKAAKIIYALCICISIILFFISNERTNNERVRKFWIINIWAYAGIIPVLVYLFIVPGIFWALCSYVVTVFVGEMVLLIIKKNK